ncbi:MAG: hypothetical protein Tsb002_11600 [Wenzhouxiangellaceae bacterium]
MTDNAVNNKPLTKPSLMLLLAANTIPLALTLSGHWSVAEVLFLFWLENVVIGLFNLLRMLLNRAPDAAQKWVLGPFFLVHYGVFTLAHGMALRAIVFADNHYDADPFDIEILWWVLANFQLWLPLAALVISHGFSFYWHYLRGGEQYRVTMSQLMSRPYARVVVMHVVLIFGGIAAVGLGQPLFALVLLVALKIVLDVRAHLREHRASG